MIYSKAPSPLELSGSGVAFDNPDFFDVRLTHFVAIPQDVVSNELQKDHKLRRCNGQCSCRVVFKASSIIVATEALLYQAQVDRWFYDDFIRKRRAVPLTPADFVVTVGRCCLAVFTWTFVKKRPSAHPEPMEMSHNGSSNLSKE
ncbi:hypothetical protein HDV57DRAFT_257093 [Trichoderma longibrachiatum]